MKKQELKIYSLIISFYYSSPRPGSHCVGTSGLKGRLYTVTMTQESVRFVTKKWSQKKRCFTRKRKEYRNFISRKYFNRRWVLRETPRWHNKKTVSSPCYWSIRLPLTTPVGGGFGWVMSWRLRCQYLFGILHRVGSHKPKVTVPILYTFCTFLRRRKVLWGSLFQRKFCKNGKK